MFGELNIYNPDTRLSLFQTNSSLPNIFIFLGGLTDGLLALPYLSKLSKVLEEHQYSLVQPLLSSSYLGYGRVNLDEDVKELDKVINYLIKKNKKACTSNTSNTVVEEEEGIDSMEKVKKNENNIKIILMGHSTGAQDAMHFAKYGKTKEYLSGIILQGAVSDREYGVYLKGKEQMDLEIEIAKTLISQNKGDNFMPPDVDDAPITANRFISLYAEGGTDDMFSSDLKDEELGKTFLNLEKIGEYKSYIECPIILISSGKDEYVPNYINIIEHSKRMQRLSSLRYWKDKKKPILEELNLSILDPGLTFVNKDCKVELYTIIKNADHAISSEDDQIKLMEIIKLFLRRIYTNTYFSTQ